MAAPEPTGEENPEPLQWLRANQELFTAMGSLAAVAAVIVASYQLSQTNNQLQATRKQLEATTIYNIQKDGRELMVGAQRDSDVWNYLMRYDAAREPYPEEVKDKADRQLWLIMQFYSSVFNQRRNGAISDLYWPDIERDFCNFLQKPAAKAFWYGKVMPGAYDSYFREIGQECLGRQSPKESLPRSYFPKEEK
jgi:hypothetical protein